MSLFRPFAQQFTNIFQELGSGVWVFVALEAKGIALSRIGGIRGCGCALSLAHKIEDEDRDNCVFFAIY